MTTIPYEEMITYYSDIIQNIFKEIEEDTPIEYGEGLKVIYPKEYHEAYGWLQKAEWRLTDTISLKDHYDEDEFKYYGIHNLKNVQQRIINYLTETDFQYSEKVTDCHKYDEYVSMNQELINDSDFHKYWEYYHNLNHLNTTIDLFDSRIRFIQHEIEYLKEDLKKENNNEIVNKKELEKTLSKMEKIVHDFKPQYKKIKP